MACRSEIVTAKAASESEYFDWMRGVGGVGVGVVKARRVGQPIENYMTASLAIQSEQETRIAPVLQRRVFTVQ